MKNLLIYINPIEDFGKEEKITIKIQIDNSLDLGWKREDIMLFTNFDFEYNGIKAIEISGDHFRSFFPPATKISAIIDLIEKGFLKDGELYWFHDLDVFQLDEITEAELELEGIDIGLCDKGRMPRWATGSVFFKTSAVDIFRLIKQVSDKYQINEEPAMNALTSNNLLWAIEERPEDVVDERFVALNIADTENINQRIKKMNISYNFAGWNIRSCYKMAIKPLKAVHFHPFEHVLYGGENVLDYFLYGKNKLRVQFVPDRLVKIFHKHGVK
jgi:hypothetical protein